MSWANDSIQRTCILAGLLVLLTAPVTMGQDIDTIAPGVKRLDTIPVPEDVAVDSVALPADEVTQVHGMDTAAIVIGQAAGGDSDRKSVVEGTRGAGRGGIGGRRWSKKKKHYSQW